MGLREPDLQLRAHVAAVHPDAGGEVLGGAVQGIDVVLAPVEVVPHLLVRHRQGVPVHVLVQRGAVLGQRGQEVRGVAVPVVEGGEGLARSGWARTMSTTSAAGTPVEICGSTRASVTAAMSRVTESEAKNVESTP